MAKIMSPGTGALYFRQSVPGVAGARYCVGHFTDRLAGVFQVTQVQMSCPDGTEIDRPRSVRMPESAIEEVDEATQIERAIAAGLLKRCTQCSQAKPLTAFHRAGPGWRPACRDCTAVQQRAYRRPKESA